MDDKESFWALKPQATEHGIVPSLMAKLAATCGDYVQASIMLQDAMGATEPVRYLGAMIRDLIKAPKIVALAKANHVPVVRIKLHDGSQGWRIGEAIYNEQGVDVGG